MSDLQTPELLDLHLHLDRAAQDLRTEDEAAIDRIVSRVASEGVRSRTIRPVAARPAGVRPMALRVSMGALTVALAGAALWPWGVGGRAVANLSFDQVAEATRNAPHSIARSYDRDGRAGAYTVWREGTKYAAELWRGRRSWLMSETRSDGRRMLHSFQWQERATAPGYRFASLGRPAPQIEARYDTLEGILRTYMVKGPQPVAQRVGDRLRYRIRPVWADKETVVVEADATSGRVVEIRSPGSRTVLDYKSPIPTSKFLPRPSSSDVVVIDMLALKPQLQRDIAGGAGAWLAGDGTLWRVYRGSTSTPPAIPGVPLVGRTISKDLQREGVVAVGSTLKGGVPETVKIGGKTVPVRKIGMIVWWKELFGKTTP